MNIGVDISMLSQPKSGIGHYVYTLIEQMTLLNEDFKFFLYGNASFKGLPERKNVLTRIVRSKTKLYWMQSLLPKILKEDKIDLFWGGNYTIPVAAGGIKKVVTVHDLVYKKYPSTLPVKRVLHLKLGMPFYLKYADHILAVSENTAIDLCKYYNIPSNKITVTKLAARKEFFYPVSKKDIEVLVDSFRLADDFILFVGTLEPRKGVDTIIEALSLMQKRSGDCPNLVLAGQIGWKSSNIINLIKKLLPVDKVSILGYVDDMQLLSLYRKAKLFVYPSCYEGFGLPVMEAMAAGVPVITTACSSLNEVGDEAPLYVEPGNAQALSEAIEKIWINEQLQNKMSVDGMEQAKKFTWKHTAQTTLKVFNVL